MSERNVELGLVAYEAWNSGDVDGLLELAAEEIEVFTALNDVEGGYRGHEGLRRWYADFHDMFPDWHAEPLDIRAVDEATVTHLRVTGHGAISAMPVDQTLWHVAHWRGGKMVRMASYETEAEAVEAADPAT